MACLCAQQTKIQNRTFFCLVYLRALDSERHAARVYESKGKGKFWLPECNDKTRACVKRGWKEIPNMALLQQAV
jgi:hypothetical protein